MPSRCQQIKSEYEQLQTLTKSYLLEFDENSANLNNLRRLKAEWEAIYDSLDERIDENQIALRDRLGRKLGLAFAGKFSEDGLARVNNGGGWYPDDKGGLAENKNGWFYIDQNGVPITSRRFQEAKDFSEGLAQVQLGFDYFFIDKIGAPMSDERFNDVGQFFNGVASVRKGDKWFYINKKGQRMFNG
ncbi:MAG: WG repeat-containing protein [Patescibacteria group bacterium]